MTKMICFRTHQLIKQQKEIEKPYFEFASKLTKLDLLQELLKYDERMKLDDKDVVAIVRAKYVMDILGDRHEFKYLKEISHEYKRKLASNLYQRVQNIV